MGAGKDKGMGMEMDVGKHLGKHMGHGRKGRKTRYTKKMMVR